MEEGDHDPGNGVSLEVGNRFSSKVSRGIQSWRHLDFSLLRLVLHF